MAKGLVVYYSRSGNTKQMAELISKSMNESALVTDCKLVSNVVADDLEGYDAIVFGSPTYYGQMAGEIKKLFDETVKHHGSLDGKVGGAFSSSANVGGGNETAVMSMIEAMLIEGMIIQGDPSGDHYGPVSIGRPDERVERQCVRRGKRIAELVSRIVS